MIVTKNIFILKWPQFIAMILQIFWNSSRYNFKEIKHFTDGMVFQSDDTL